MAVEVYKNGEKHLVKPNALQRYLEAGYTLEPTETAEAAETAETAEAETFDSVDTNDSGKLSHGEIREAAKRAGINGWKTKRIDTLKSELGL